MVRHVAWDDTYDDAYCDGDEFVGDKVDDVGDDDVYVGGYVGYDDDIDVEGYVDCEDDDACGHAYYDYGDADDDV